MTQDLLPRLEAALQDRYRIERPLGTGGMATVYLAEDLKHRRKVAVKVLRPELAAALGSERFLREIEITAKLNHPHILPLYDSGQANGFLYYVMPHVEGESLRDRLNREKQLPIEEAVRITCDVARALSFAHSLGLVHRDVKPENVLLHHGEAVVADFGIAQALATAGGKRITAKGVALGTPSYMSPEQANVQDVDGRSDLYSLACVLFEMLTGQQPFSGPSSKAIMAKHAMEAPPRVSVLRPTVPEYVDTAINKAMAKVPADRFTTGTEFAEALQGSIGIAPASIADASKTPGCSISRWVRVSGAAAIVMSLIILGAVKWKWFSGEPFESDLLFVVPFETRGTSEILETVGAGMADLFDELLRYRGPLATIPPDSARSVWLAAGEGKTLRHDQILDIAQALGARWALDGAVVQQDEQLSVNFRLSHVEAGSYRGSSVSGAEDSMPQLLRDMAFEVIMAYCKENHRARDGNISYQMWQSDSLRTAATLDSLFGQRSVQALRAYMEGHGWARRGEYRHASERFLESFVADPTFRLAGYALWRTAFELPEGLRGFLLQSQDIIADSVLATLMREY